MSKRFSRVKAIKAETYRRAITEPSPVPMPKSRVRPFKRLVAALIRAHGSQEAVWRNCGIHSSTVWRLEHDNVLSAVQARKILDAYNALKDDESEDGRENNKTECV